jgi:hypothetical protein
MTLVTDGQQVNDERQARPAGKEELGINQLIFFWIKTSRASFPTANL